MKRFAALALASFTAVALVACQKDEPAGETPKAAAEATANPADAITATAQKLKNNDVLGVSLDSIPTMPGYATPRRSSDTKREACCS